jgi:hypothetical protein
MALARQVLAEIPGQVCDYMKSRGLHPKGYVDPLAAHTLQRSGSSASRLGRQDSVTVPLGNYTFEA